MRTHRTRGVGAARQRGVGLIEVMMAVLVLAVGMLGVAAMQVVALRDNQSASERSAAVTQSYAIFDALRTDRDNALKGDYDLTEWACELPEAGSFVNNELRNWIANTQAELGDSACVKLQCGTDKCEVRVRWDDSRGTHDADDDSASELEIVTVSQI